MCKWLLGKALLALKQLLVGRFLLCVDLFLRMVDATGSIKWPGICPDLDIYLCGELQVSASAKRFGLVWAWIWKLGGNPNRINSLRSCNFPQQCQNKGSVMGCKMDLGTSHSKLENLAVPVPWTQNPGSVADSTRVSGQDCRKKCRSALDGSLLITRGHSLRCSRIGIWYWLKAEARTGPIESLKTNGCWKQSNWSTTADDNCKLNFPASLVTLRLLLNSYLPSSWVH